MSAAVGDTLPLAVAVALSPLPVIALILILLSRRARSNGLAYLAGWIVGLVIAVVAVLALVSMLSLAPGDTAKTAASALRLLFGALLLVLGVRQWRRLSQSGKSPSLPAWMTSIDSFTPARAFGLAVLLSSIGNLPLILAAGLEIGRAKLNVGQDVAVIAIFTVIASLIVGAVVIYHILSRERAALALDAWKVWMLANNSALTAALLMVVGALLIGKGISGLGLLG